MDEMGLRSVRNLGDDRDKDISSSNHKFCIKCRFLKDEYANKIYISVKENLRWIHVEEIVARFGSKILH